MSNERTLACASALITALAIAGCDSPSTPPTPVDGGGGTDGGAVEGGGMPVDGGRVDGGGMPVDGGRPTDGGRDAGMMTACDAPIPDLGATMVASGFSSPVDAVFPPGSTDMYVVERGGRIRIVRGGMVLPTPFATFTTLIGGTPMGGDEQGLLGLAFHPDYATNGRFFIAYAPRAVGRPTGTRNVVAEGRRSAVADVAEPTVTPLIDVADPYWNHNGGNLVFGPDGYLYIGTGDAGAGGDPDQNGQDLGSLFAKMLRIDVNSRDAGLMYAVPPTNPFVGMAGVRGEIWAYGLRNPWRYSFDRATGDMWIGDVGQDRFEEIDFQPASSGGGENYGWSRFEGAAMFSGRALGGPSPHTPPLLSIAQGSGSEPLNGACSITGGYVYRGSAIAGLAGTYLFGDYCSGSIVGVRACGGAVTRPQQRIAGLTDLDSGGLVSFGEDNAGELYIVYIDTGRIYRIVAR